MNERQRSTGENEIADSSLNTPTTTTVAPAAACGPGRRRRHMQIRRTAGGGAGGGGGGRNGPHRIIICPSGASSPETPMRPPPQTNAIVVRGVGGNVLFVDVVFRKQKSRVFAVGQTKVLERRSR